MQNINHQYRKKMISVPHEKTLDTSGMGFRAIQRVTEDTILNYSSFGKGIDPDIEMPGIGLMTVGQRALLTFDSSKKVHAVLDAPFAMPKRDALGLTEADKDKIFGGFATLKTFADSAHVGAETRIVVDGKSYILNSYVELRQKLYRDVHTDLINMSPEKLQKLIDDFSLLRKLSEGFEAKVNSTKNDNKIMSFLIGDIDDKIFNFISNKMKIVDIFHNQIPKNLADIKARGITSEADIKFADEKFNKNVELVDAIQSIAETNKEIDSSIVLFYKNDFAPIKLKLEKDFTSIAKQGMSAKDIEALKAKINIPIEEYMIDMESSDIMAGKTAVATVKTGYFAVMAAIDEFVKGNISPVELAKTLNRVVTAGSHFEQGYASSNNSFDILKNKLSKLFGNGAVNDEFIRLKLDYYTFLQTQNLHHAESVHDGLDKTKISAKANLELMKIESAQTAVAQLETLIVKLSVDINVARQTLGLPPQQSLSSPDVTDAGNVDVSLARRSSLESSMAQFHEVTEASAQVGIAEKNEAEKSESLNNANARLAAQNKEKEQPNTPKISHMAI